MRFRTSIQQKILLLLLSLALPPLILVGWLGLAGLARARETLIAEGTSALRAQKEAELAQRAADKAQLYDLALASVQQQVESTASYAAVLYDQAERPPSAARIWVAPAPSPALLDANVGEVAYVRQLIPVLRAAVDANPLVNIGYVALERGGVVAFDDDAVIDALLKIQPFDPRTRPWYTAAREQRVTVWVDTYVDANTGLLATHAPRRSTIARAASLAWSPSTCCSRRSRRICLRSILAARATRCC
jgi:two-component system sensor histidine kinase/response regulator